MKKIFIYGAAALAGIFSLTNCTKEASIETPAAGVPFEIYAGSAEVSTKTTISGFSTSWKAKDSINLFHAVSGTTAYQNDGKFTIADPASGKFTGTLTAALESGENYDWYALYPYDSRITTPASRTKGYSVIGSTYNSTQTQAGANSTAHLAGYNYPLYGKSSAPTAGAEAPSITLNPAFSVVEIEVKNSTANDLPVSNITFTAPEVIVGTFYIDFSGETPTYTPSGNTYAIPTASLSVTGNATIAANASAKFYLAVKPFTAASGSTLKISVNGYEKSLTLTSAATFTAGKIKTLNFNYDKKPVAGVKTYQHIFTAKPGIGNNISLSNVKWNISATELWAYNNQNYAGVQFGTSTKLGSITLTSSSTWSYDGATKVKEIRVWMNTGGSIDPATVTIGGVAASSAGIVVKNSKAVSDYSKASKITYTPASNGTTGVIVISATTKSKAGYICAIEIDCE